MLRIRLLVSYDGSGFCGWQRQWRDDVPSLQATLEEALEKIFRQKITLQASGRTDAGVNAIGQVCDFLLDATEEFMRSRDWCWSIQGMLPPSFIVRKMWIAPMEFHATLSATHKTYRYFVYNSPRQHPFMRRTSEWVRRPLDLDHLNESASCIVGKHDFKAFQSMGTPVKSTVRKVYEARWERKSAHVLRFTITGQGFLKQMVRNIVGTSLKLEKDGRKPSEMKEILESLDRRRAAAPAAAQGLFLWKVYYPRELDKQCRPL